MLQNFQNIRCLGLSLIYLQKLTDYMYIGIEGYLKICQLEIVMFLFQLECVGSVSCGIKAAAWSPDLDLVVIITGLKKLPVFMHIFKHIGILLKLFKMVQNVSCT